MKVIAVSQLEKAKQQYPSAESFLLGWFQLISSGDFKSESSLRDVFGDIRGFEHEFKFLIPDSNLLVHTLINFETQVVMIVKIKSGNQ